MSVLIVGAGPSGARLAIQLAQAGVEVTLVDRLADPHRHAYSSGALPLEAVRRLGLPDDAIAATWQGWQLHDPSGLVISGGRPAIWGWCSTSAGFGPGSVRKRAAMGSS